MILINVKKVILLLLLLIPLARQEHQDHVHEPVLFSFSNNLFRTGKQLVLLASNSGQQMFRDIESYITFLAGRKDFNSKHVSLNTKVSATELSKNHLNATAVSLNQSSARTVTSISLVNGGYSPQDIDILFKTRSSLRESKTNIAVSIFKSAFSS